MIPFSWKYYNEYDLVVSESLYKKARAVSDEVGIGELKIRKTTVDPTLVGNNYILVFRPRPWFEFLFRIAKLFKSL